MVRAENERMASVQLRTLIDNVVNDTSRDMKEQADAVDAAFQKRVIEVENAKSALEDNLRKVRICLLFHSRGRPALTVDVSCPHPSSTTLPVRRTNGAFPVYAASI